MIQRPAALAGAGAECPSIALARAGGQHSVAMAGRDPPYGTSPACAGLVVALTTSGVVAAGSGRGIVESDGQVVRPRSLYLQQLRDRLGEQAVIGVTTEAQRKGRIWNSLSIQSGE